MTRERREPPDIIREHELDWDHFKIIPTRHYIQSILTDFFSAGASMNPPWLGAALSSGTGISQASQIPTGIQRTGWVALKSSGSANSGYRYMTDVDSILLAGGERIELNFIINSSTNLKLRFGFQNSNTSAAPNYGVWFALNGTTLTGETIDTSSAATTASNYTVSLYTVYRAEIILNEDAALATFTIYDANGDVLWTDTLATNIPIAEGEELGQGVIAYEAVAGTSVILVYLDRMQFDCDREIAR